MADFPPLPYEEWGDIPAGHELRWVPEDGRWRTIESYAIGSRPCRYTVGPDHATCKKPSVAMLNRSHRTVNNRFGTSWWHYCEEHLYGRVIVDGVIYHAALREVTEPIESVASITPIRPSGSGETGTPE